MICIESSNALYLFICQMVFLFKKPSPITIKRIVCSYIYIYIHIYIYKYTYINTGVPVAHVIWTNIRCQES